MQRLKSRAKQIPNGMFFRQPEISWDSRKVLGMHPSFDTLVRAVISARKSNPHHAAKHKWALDFDPVANEVETFQVKVCLAAGWTSYLTEAGGGAPPFSRAQSLQNQKNLGVAVAGIKKIWSGIKTANDWLDSEEPPVPSEQAEKRAATCVKCQLNTKGNFTDWFTVPASGAIKRQLERLHQRNITTSQDELLQVCSGCLCPLKVKVQTPIKFITPHMTPETLEELKKGKNCWVIAEMAS